MPHSDSKKACDLILERLPDVPFWPQLPTRSPKETMFAQAAQGFPGATPVKTGMTFRAPANLSQALDMIASDYEAKAVDKYSMGADCSLGLHSFLRSSLGSSLAVKGQLMGPVSLSLMMKDRDGRPTLYDDAVVEGLAKHLALKASWQEKALSKLNPRTIIFIDEPAMAAMTTDKWPRQRLKDLLDIALEPLEGLKGIHCCNHADWSIILECSIDILSFDGYSYPFSLRPYIDQVKDFLHKGGIISWGIVPTREESLFRESGESLFKRLEAEARPLVEQGITEEELWSHSLITPSCGLATLSEKGAERALAMAADLSEEVRSRWRGKTQISV